MNITIVGGGIFGFTAALELRGAGAIVDEIDLDLSEGRDAFLARECWRLSLTVA